MNEEVVRARLRLLGHVARMDKNDRALRQLVDSTMNRNKVSKRGRPRLSWIQVVRKDIENRGYDLFSTIKLAQDRHRYREQAVYGRQNRN